MILLMKPYSHDSFFFPGTFGKSKYVYYGRHSEGNRFIRNSDLWQQKYMNCSYFGLNGLSPWPPLLQWHQRSRLTKWGVMEVTLSPLCLGVQSCDTFCECQGHVNLFLICIYYILNHDILLHFIYWQNIFSCLIFLHFKISRVGFFFLDFRSTLTKLRGRMPSFFKRQTATKIY